MSCVPNAFEPIAASKPELLMIDLVLGERAGWGLPARLERDAVSARIAVIVVSTMPNLLQRAAANQARYAAGRYLAKPFDIDDTRRPIDLLIGKAVSRDLESASASDEAYPAGGVAPRAGSARVGLPIPYPYSDQYTGSGEVSYAADRG